MGTQHTRLQPESQNTSSHHFLLSRLSLSCTTGALCVIMRLRKDRRVTIMVRWVLNERQEGSRRILSLSIRNLISYVALLRQWISLGLTRRRTLAMANMLRKIQVLRHWGIIKMFLRLRLVRWLTASSKSRILEPVSMSQVLSLSLKTIQKSIKMFKCSKIFCRSSTNSIHNHRKIQLIFKTTFSFRESFSQINRLQERSP